MDYKSICWFSVMTTLFPLLAMGQERMLFQFNNPQELQAWRSVNDGVMGGRSTGRVSYDGDGALYLYTRIWAHKSGEARRGIAKSTDVRSIFARKRSRSRLLSAG